MADEKPPPQGTADRQVELLRQLANLAASVEQLAQRTTPRDVTPSDDKTKPPTSTQKNAQFAYRFLGELLVRRDSIFVPLLRTTATRQVGNKVTFSQLHGGKVAKLRGRDGAIDTLKELTEGGQQRLEHIASDVPVDAIALLDEGGALVAIGPCLGPAPKIP
jgi:hypothetical protein